MQYAPAISLLLAAAGLGNQPVRAANAFQAEIFQASGPVAVLPNQSATVCATNLGSHATTVLLAFLNAGVTPAANNQGGNAILAAREAALDPGKGACFAKTGTELSTGKGTPGGGDIVAVVVPGGIFTGTTDPNGMVVQSGIIKQNITGGQGGVFGDILQGGIVASLQILNGGAPVLYPNMALRVVNLGPPGAR